MAGLLCFMLVLQILPLSGLSLATAGTQLDLSIYDNGIMDIVKSISAKGEIYGFPLFNNSCPWCTTRICLTGSASLTRRTA
jgi:hypothetical protein